MAEREKKLDPAVDVLQRLFENSKSPLAEGFRRYRLEQRWVEVVGKNISRNTRPVDFNKGLLTIAVSNSSLLTELQFFRQDILTKVNTFVGCVWAKKVRFISE